MYNKTIEQIVSILKNESIISIKGQKYKIVEMPEDGNSDYKMTFINLNNNETSTRSLRILYNKELIDEDGIIFVKDKNVKNEPSNSRYNLYDSVKEILTPSTNGAVSAKNYYSKKLNFDDINDYKDLDRFLFQYDDSKRKEFYHVTAMENAIEIINSGFIKSRFDAGTNIAFDNVEMIDTSNEVMSSNRSSFIEKYARFYFNIRNAATYLMMLAYSQRKTFGVVIAINSSAICHEGINHVYISPQNAHDLTQYDLDWKLKRMPNINKKYELHSIKVSDFDFKKTYEPYSPETRNDYQMAEILFYDRVPIECITHLYFANETEKGVFLSRLSGENRIRFGCKCVVDPYLLWRKR